MAFWTDENFAKLKELMLDNTLSADAIARRLGPGFTRCAVIGKINRNKMVWSRSSDVSRERSRQAARIVAKRLEAARIKAEASAKSRDAGKAKTMDRLTVPRVPIPNSDGWQPTPEVVPVKLFSLADWPDDKCKAPYGGWGKPAMFGCPCERVPGLPYCADHTRKFFQPPDPKRVSRSMNAPKRKTGMPADGTRAVDELLGDRETEDA